MSSDQLHEAARDDQGILLPANSACCVGSLMKGKTGLKRHVPYTATGHLLHQS